MKEWLGQVLCVGVPEGGLTQEFLSFFRRYLPGNFILFRRNATRGPRALRELVKGLMHLVSSHGLSVPPLICVDQEGGRVVRLAPPYWPRLPGFGEVARASDPQGAILALAQDSARMLKDVGINVNLSPCLDLFEEGAPAVLHQRTLSSDPEAVASLGVQYIRTLRQHGIASVAKHFPGIGGIDVDPHLDFSVVKAPKARQHLALHPFRVAVQAGVFGIMTSHVLVPAYDPDNIVTFSRKLIKVLREELGFGGVVFTDDLFMGAIERHHGLGDAGALALEAGHDMLLYCHDLHRTASAIDELMKHLERDDTLVECMKESSKRIIHMKKQHWEW